MSDDVLVRFLSWVITVAIIALVALVSSSTLLTTSPIALAAGTATEALDDGTRPLAGATRYDTAAKIAQKFVENSSALDGYVVGDAIVVSGTSFADALPAAALAGYRRAPILLTLPTELVSEVRAFVTRNSISRIHIIGGTDAVSTEVETALAAINGVTVTRLAGEDRYATALVVAREVAGIAAASAADTTEGATNTTGPHLGTYCVTNEPALLLATGEGFADALAGGPMAYAGPLPIILTPGTGLRPDALAFLRASQATRVVILGGTAVISDAIQTQITDLGIATTRLAGSDRFATATAITQALTTSCWEPDAFGIANGRIPFDALAASPLLGLHEDPLLLTEPTSLPTATTDWLAASPTRGNTASSITFSVLGGTAVVPANVVAQAITAAINAEPITATIVAYPNEFRFVVNFSEAVDRDTAELKNSYLLDGVSLTDKYTVTYYPPDPMADNPFAHALVDLCCTRLAPSVVITVQPTAIKAARHDTNDNRHVVATTHTVPATRPLP